MPFSTKAILLVLLASACAGRAVAQAAPPAEDAVLLDGVVSAYGEAPLPRVGVAVPNYSPEQTASMVCIAQALGPAEQRRAQAAYEATVRARDVRVRAFNGAATEAEMIDAELARQRAIRSPAGYQTERDLPSRSYQGLVAEEVRYRRILEDGRPVWIVEGSLRNTSARRVALPPLTMEALDLNGFVLAGQTSVLEQVDIEPRASLPFTLRFKNPPTYAVKVAAHFAPPFVVRNYRGCDFFDPLGFDLSPPEALPASAAAPLPPPGVGPGAPRYTALELSGMAVQARVDAEVAYRTAYGLGVVAPLQCPDAPRLSWRSLMILSDLLDEAWVATNAADEVRRDGAAGVFLPAEVEAAELNRQRAVNAFMAARPRLSTPDQPQFALLSIRQDALQWQSAGDELQLSGWVSNSASRVAAMPALRVAALDRFGYVVSERILKVGGGVKASGASPFTLRFEAPAKAVSRVEVTFAC